MTSPTRPSRETRDAERDEASEPAGADRMPTEDEERLAEEKTVSHYDVLGVTPSARTDEIRQAYHMTVERLTRPTSIPSRRRRS